MCAGSRIRILHSWRVPRLEMSDFDWLTATLDLYRSEYERFSNLIWDDIIHFLR